MLMHDSENKYPPTPIVFHICTSKLFRYTYPITHLN